MRIGGSEPHYYLPGSPKEREVFSNEVGTTEEDETIFNPFDGFLTGEAGADAIKIT
jgi:hypothetical protein